MVIFYLMAMLMANGFQQHQAVLFMEQQAHIAHVKHVEHVDYQIYLTKLEQATPAPIAPTIQSAPVPKTLPTQPAPVSTYVAPAGDYSCSALESLWVSAGGNPASEFIAAQIATAESGGNPDAISPTNDYGLWQINGSWGAMASLNPWTNVHSAITISNDGTNWSPWTTFTSGAYASEC